MIFQFVGSVGIKISSVDVGLMGVIVGACGESVENS